MSVYNYVSCGGCGTVCDLMFLTKQFIKTGEDERGKKEGYYKWKCPICDKENKARHI